MGTPLSFHEVASPTVGTHFQFHEVASPTLGTHFRIHEVPSLTLGTHFLFHEVPSPTVGTHPRIHEVPSPQLGSDLFFSEGFPAIGGNTTPHNLFIFLIPPNGIIIIELQNTHNANALRGYVGGRFNLMINY